MKNKRILNLGIMVSGTLIFFLISCGANENKNQGGSIARRTVLPCSVGCAGVQAQLEEARYLLGKGDATNVDKALTLITSALGKATGENHFEAIRLFAGAKMAKAGFSPFRIVSFFFNKGGQDELAVLRGALTSLTDDSEALLTEAETNLDNAAKESDFASQSDRVKNGINFQFGLVNFLDALRIAAKETGLTVDTGSLSVQACKDNLGADFQDKLDLVNGDLDSANTGFGDSGLSADNPIRKIVTSIQNSSSLKTAAKGVEQLDKFCEYISEQSAK